MNAASSPKVASGSRSSTFASRVCKYALSACSVLFTELRLTYAVPNRELIGLLPSKWAERRIEAQKEKGKNDPNFTTCLHRFSREKRSFTLLITRKALVAVGNILCKHDRIRLEL